MLMLIPRWRTGPHGHATVRVQAGGGGRHRVAATLAVEKVGPTRPKGPVMLVSRRWKKTLRAWHSGCSIPRPEEANMLQVAFRDPVSSCNQETFGFDGELGESMSGEVGETPGMDDPGRRLEAGCQRFGFWVRRLAARFARRLPAHIELEELISAGSVGLVLALQQHGDKPEAELERLVVQRVRGAILDYLREEDPLSRRQRSAVAAFKHAKAELLQAGEAGDVLAVAQRLGISAERAQKIADELEPVQLTPLGSLEIPEPAADPMQAAIDGQQRACLIGALARLPERLRTLLSLYYYEELTYQEISEVLSISRSRICQLHTQALALLRQALEPAVQAG